MAIMAITGKNKKKWVKSAAVTLGVEPQEDHQEHDRPRRANAEGQHVETRHRVGEALEPGVPRTHRPDLQQRRAYSVPHKQRREEYVDEHNHTHESPRPQVRKLETRELEPL